MLFVAHALAAHCFLLLSCLMMKAVKAKTKELHPPHKTKRHARKNCLKLNYIMWSYSTFSPTLMRASNRTKSPISTLCKIANTTNNKRASQRLCKHPTRLPSCCSRAFSHRTPTRKAVSRAKGTFIFCVVLCRSLRSVNGRACGSKELRSCFIGAIFQCPKPLWMLIFYDEAARSHRTNQSFITKNRAVTFFFK